ncbi:GyrI-like domain-containing protein [Blastococcus sp. SYSU DS0617]
MESSSEAVTSGPELVPVVAAQTAVVRGEVPTAQLPAFFDDAFSRLPRALGEQGLAPLGAAFARYSRPPAQTADLEVGFVVDGRVRPDGGVQPGELPGGRVARLVHAGSFDGLGDSWERLFAWVQQQGLTPGEGFWEVYLTEPAPDMDPVELRSELNVPIRD